MEKDIEYKLMEELRQQCRLALYGFQTLRSQANSVEAEKVFFYVHAFLAHAQNISRLLWPVREESRERGEILRKALEIGDDSPLALRDIQGQLGGWDERFEDWLGNLEKRDYLSMNVMPSAAIGDFKQDDFQQSLDPDTFKLELRGARCDLKGVTQAIRELDTKLQHWLRTHQPW